MLPKRTWLWLATARPAGRAAQGREIKHALHVFLICIELASVTFDKYLKYTYLLVLLGVRIIPFLKWTLAEKVVLSAKAKIGASGFVLTLTKANIILMKSHYHAILSCQE
jgi:hypothetical protein